MQVCWAGLVSNSDFLQSCLIGGERGDIVQLGLVCCLRLVVGEGGDIVQLGLWLPLYSLSPHICARVQLGPSHGQFLC